MPLLSNQLEIDRCPHCGVNKPSLRTRDADSTETTTHENKNKRFWRFYICSRCGGVVTAAARGQSQSIMEMYPAPKEVNESIPARAKDYLSQAIDTIHAPAGSVMLSASAVDAMLKEKDYKDGSLYDRINQAAKDNLITDDMAKWAHEIRLDANDQRHSDKAIGLPAEEDAQKSVDFALAFAQFLFVLPSRVQRGLADTTS